MSAAAVAIGSLVLDTARKRFRSLKSLAEEAFEQLDDAQIHQVPGPECNSVAVIAKHVVGNLRSRWADFLTTDGEKLWRNRDTEFEDDRPARAGFERRWHEAWQILFDVLDELTPDDLMREVTIRGEPHSVIDAIERQHGHYAYHVGQIVYAAKLMLGARWRTLSVPRGDSGAFNASMGYHPERGAHDP